MKSKKQLSITLLVVVLFSGCIRTPFCETGYGEITTEQRFLNDFNKIDLNISGNVYISQGDTQSVVISAQQNIINTIETNVMNNELEIEFDECISFHDGIEIFITIKDFESLQVSGSGSFLSEGHIDADFLELIIDGSGEINLGDLLVEEKIISMINGSGNISLAGPESTKTHNIEINGSGNIYAYGLPTINTNINIDGSGNA
jgi:hypothetical protein